MRFLLLLFATINLRLVHGADDCSPVDNSSHFGEVRNQENSEWCYAFTAADLLGEKIGLPSSQQISAYDVALNYYTVHPKAVAQQLPEMQFPAIGDQAQTKRGLLELANSLANENRERHAGEKLDERGLGYAGRAISMYNFRGGYCLESQLPSQPEDTSPGTSPAAQSAEVDPIQKGNPFVTPNAFMTFIQKQTRQLEREGHISDCLHGVSFKNRQDFAKLASQVADIAVAATSRAAEKHCEPRHKFPPTIGYLSIVAPPAQSVDAIFPNFTKNLNEHRSIGISFNKCAINKLPHGVGKECDHEAIVIGRKRGAGGECEYQVRNSWGHDCSHYEDSIAKTCDAKNGTFWIGETKLKTIFNGATIVP